jgi:hypothetical protein
VDEVVAVSDIPVLRWGYWINSWVSSTWRDPTCRTRGLPRTPPRASITVGFKLWRGPLLSWTANLPPSPPRGRPPPNHTSRHSHPRESLLRGHILLSSKGSKRGPPRLARADADTSSDPLSFAVGSTGLTRRRGQDYWVRRVCSGEFRSDDRQRFNFLDLSSMLHCWCAYNGTY